MVPDDFKSIVVIFRSEVVGKANHSWIPVPGFKDVEKR